jgi:hypothetical protein
MHASVAILQKKNSCLPKQKVLGLLKNLYQLPSVPGRDLKLKAPHCDHAARIPMQGHFFTKSQRYR